MERLGGDEVQMVFIYDFWGFNFFFLNDDSTFIIRKKLDTI